MSKVRTSGRFIPSEDVGTAVSWSFGAVDPAAALAAEDAWREREDAAAAREAAYTRGFEAGVEAGREVAGREIEKFMRDRGQQASAQLSQLVRGLTDSLEDARQEMAVQILDLACEIARQVVRSELRARPDGVKAVVDEALALIAQDASPRVVSLHPDDLAMVKEGLDPAAQVVWRADPTLTPGGCTVEAGGTIIDGTLEKRWTRAVANLGNPTGWRDVADEHR